MSEGYGYKDSEHYSKLNNYYNNCLLTLAKHVDYEDQRKKSENEIKIANNNIKILSKSISRLKEMIKDVKDYQDEKERKGMGGIYRGFYNTLQVIPSAAGCVLDRKGGKAIIRTSAGYPIQYIEGGAFRSILAMFTRNSVLKNSEDYLDFLMLDESLAVVKEDKSAEISMYIDKMSEEFQMVMAEQKKEIFENIKKLTVYNFEKLEGVTRIKEVRDE